MLDVLVLQVCNNFIVLKKKFKMKIEEFLKFDTAKLHRELTNILLIATEESNHYCCYCRQTSKCALCQLCSFPYATKEQKIDGLPPKKFLQKFYNVREKLEKFLNIISLFFEKMYSQDKRSVQFFNKEYSWSLRNYQEGTYLTMTLDEIIDSDKIFVRNNPKLFNSEFIKRHPHCF